MTEARTTYEKLKEAAHLADVIEAAECGQLLDMIDRIRETHSKKVSGAATPETDETH